MAEHPGKKQGARMLRESGYGMGKQADIHGAPAQEPGVMPPVIGAGMPHKRGGMVKGMASKSRPDRRARGGSTTDDQPDDRQGNVNAASKRADGGRTGKNGKTIININAGGDQGGDDARVQAAHQAGMQQGAQLGAQAAAAKMAGAGGGGAPRPPMPGGPMPPPGVAPPMPPPGAGGPPGMPPHPMMPPPGGMPGAPPGGPMPPMMRAQGGRTRDGRTGRFTGGAV